MSDPDALADGGTDDAAQHRALDDARALANPQTDVLSQETFLAQDTEQPSWAPGPFARDDRLTFELREQWDDPAGVGWTSTSIINPSLIVRGDELHVFYRASPRKESLSSRIGHAVYVSGLGWRDDPQNPVIYPTLPNEELGVEDPKVYRHAGHYVMFYNAIFPVTAEDRADLPSPGYPVGDVGVDINVAISDDLVTWHKLGPVTDRRLTRLWAKGAVIPRSADGSAVQLGGEYLMYLSEGFDGVLHIGRSRDLIHWQYEPIPYLDLSPLGDHLHEVATATVMPEGLVLDLFYGDADGWAAGRVEYPLDAPFTQRRVARGGTLAWGGLVQWQGRWAFAQGWDARPGHRELFVYTAPTP
jgi:beta-1,2-mannosidase